jgi:periplasmic protein TonB
MYLEFDDRPDTPRLPPALSRLERALILLVIYLVVIVVYLVTPNSVWQRVEPPPPIPEQPIEYVRIEPNLDRLAPPKRPAPASDLDRRATTPEPIPKPETDAPKSVGNTPEKVTSPPPAETMKGPESPSPPSDTNTSPATPNMTAKVSPNAAPAEGRAPSGVLGDALRNVQRYIQGDNFDNPQGGGADSGQDIQFDSKGVDFGAWLRKFRAQVYHNWLIPESAMVLHGHVVIEMTVARNGTLSGIRIVQGSGIAAFDSAAFNALKQSNPTAVLPTAYPLDTISPFTVTFFYNERIR